MTILSKKTIENRLRAEYGQSPDLQNKFSTVHDFMKQVFCSRTKPITVHEDLDDK